MITGVCCVKHCGAGSLATSGYVVTNCVCPKNLLEHMRVVHHFIPSTSQSSDCNGEARFLGAGWRSKGKVSASLLRVIVRDLRPCSARSAWVAHFLSDMHLVSHQRTYLPHRLVGLLVSDECAASEGLGSFPFSVSIDGWSTGVKQKAMYCFSLSLPHNELLSHFTST
jgi:hypothetical protein